MRRKKILILLFNFGVLSACTMAPKYQTPKVDAPLKPIEATKPKITNISWQEFFISSDLQRVIKIALKNNRDLKIANLNIESAQASYGVTRSDLFPSVNATAYETRQGVPSAFKSFTPKKQFRANLSLTSYELDFFGRLRSLKNAALEDFLAQEQARNITKISLIAETANSYAQLLCDSEILKISQENVAIQTARLDFTKLRYENGIDSLDSLLNAQASIETAKSNFEKYKKLVAQDKNALLVLMGTFDQKLLPQISDLNDIKINEASLDFTPSQSLLLRPDIQQAEHNLKSANANIGAARAAFFPTITLTGTYGYASRDFKTLFDSKTWAFTPQVSLPIFSGGRNFANLEISNVRKKVEIINYEKAIQTAFREASDQFAERESVTNQLKSFEEILSMRQKSQQISEKKHEAGINSTLNVLDAKLAFLSAKENHANTKKEYIANLINLYKVLGGGIEIVEFGTEEK